MKTIAVVSTILLLTSAVNAYTCVPEETQMCDVNQEERLFERTLAFVFPFMDKYCTNSTNTESCELFSKMYIQFMFHATSPDFQRQFTNTLYQFNRIMTPMMKDIKNSTNGTECEACKMMVYQIQEYLSSQAVRDELMELLHTACHYLPRPVDHQCDTFVDTYIPRIVDLVVDSPPEVLCTMMAMC